MLEELKKQVCKANVDLVQAGLVVHTWGNASGIDREGGLFVIKPSGMSYDNLKPNQMVVVSLDSGEVIEGKLKPSSDAPTHRVLYRAFKEIGGIVHTHSLYAAAWAQARREIPALGTTHADFCPGPVPCTRPMTVREIRSDYEANTGKVIVERFAELDSMSYPAVLVASHGPFTWGKSVEEAVTNAIILEHLAQMASETLRLNPSIRMLSRALLHKHFSRKHGPGAYYGQK